ncbi:peptide/nickel transport system permease protein [Microbacterium terrae]|uniref:Glutathione transport system permease protein GsiD n=1 Tax=Microbacterium terrae TaxID=69369 RepID=A0A0M2H4J1_9MICO|nr:ABC transporter permease [Microbacterium terrae]KJL38652.1 Glutathione transport system permease protein GsiD [Microbacterium terrae]MBP1076071.1 peptide/nickel transport system permease protein [Microbacterium terrae]GLJ96891.1 peptide ABC transporter permease [Microbacterium terrae]
MTDAILAAPTSSGALPPRSRRRGSARPLILVGVAFLTTVVAFVVIVPLLPDFDPMGQDLSATNLPAFQDAAHPLGTDALGRDMMSRLALGGRISLLLTLAIVLINLIIGTIIGLIAGYRGGWADNALSTVSDVQLALPVVLLLMALAATLGSSVGLTVVVLGVSYWMGYARVARSIAMSLRDRDFVLAPILQGATTAHVLRRHILPSVAGPLLIVTVTDIGAVMLILAGLDYLGLGVQPPTPTWGGMIFEGQRMMRLVPSQALLPGIAMFFVIGGAAFISQRFTTENGDFVLGRKEHR